MDDRSFLVVPILVSFIGLVWLLCWLLQRGDSRRNPNPPPPGGPPAVQTIPAPPRPAEPPAFQIGVLDVKPGDIVVVRIADKLPTDAFMRMLGNLNTTLPAGTKAVVLDAGCELSVMRSIAGEGKSNA